MKRYRTLLFRTATRRAAVSLALMTAALATFGSSGGATPTLAAFHINLASSVPAKDSHVVAPVREIRLTFTGSVDVSKASVQLLDASSGAVAIEPLRAVPDSVRVAVARVPGNLAGGTYTVRWQAIAEDGAQGSGSFSFMYMPPAANR